MGKELFKNIPSKVGDLVKDVRNGRIGLPDLQRPFVWRDNKVRELFDSMLKGYPIGYIIYTFLLFFCCFGCYKGEKPGNKGFSPATGSATG